VKIDEESCPHCGAPVRDARGQIGRTASAMLMGLAISCGGDDASTATVADDSMSASGPSSSGSASASVSDSTTDTNNTLDETFGDVEYGSAETLDDDVGTTTSVDDTTGTDSTGTDSTGTDSTGTDSGSTGASDTAGEPEYGVPETG